MVKLPTILNQTKIGKKATKFLESIFNEFCIIIPYPQESDVGIDFNCELLRGKTKKRSNPTGKHFFIQCKGMTEVTEARDYIQVPIKVKTINYWLLQPAPTFLIVIDDTSKKCYWMFPEGELNKQDMSWKKQDTITFKVPKSSGFGFEIKNLPIKMKRIIDTHELNWKQKLDKIDNLMSFFLPNALQSFSGIPKAEFKKQFPEFKLMEDYTDDELCQKLGITKEEYLKNYKQVKEEYKRLNNQMTDEVCQEHGTTREELFEELRNNRIRDELCRKLGITEEELFKRLGITKEELLEKSQERDLKI